MVSTPDEPGVDASAPHESGLPTETAYLRDEFDGDEPVFDEALDTVRRRAALLY